MTDIDEIEQAIIAHFKAVGMMRDDDGDYFGYCRPRSLAETIVRRSTNDRT